MTKVLGLDLGTNSIGWAVVDKEGEKILDAGVRIFPEGVEPTTIGKGDNEQSKNATRREKRQLRRHFYRKRLRKIKLLEVLIGQKMCPLRIEDLRKWKNWNSKEKAEGRRFPSTIEFDRWIQMNPYELRDKALREQVTLFEFGRIMYNLIQRRGFLSSRKGEQDPKTLFEKGKPDENILPVNETKEKIGNTSLGSYLNSIAYKENTPYKTRTDVKGNEIRVRGRYTVRKMYVEEFMKIWDKQNEYYDLDVIKLKTRKIRELRGSLNGARNRNKLEYLVSKYGEENVIIEQKSNNITQVITISEILLKKYLGGEIYYVENEEGEKKLKFRSNESVLFWQRPLKSQKSLLTDCRFESNLPVIMSNCEIRKDKEGKFVLRSKKPCPISHPEFELFRAYQFVNNIRFGRNTNLTNEQKDTVLDLINSKDASFYFSDIRKKLELTYEKFNYDDKFKVVGNPTIKKLSSLFDKKIWEENYQDIWHCFYFYDDNQKLFEKLKKDYDYSKGIDLLVKVKLKDGYSNVSLKAIRNILPFLKKGYQYDKAVILGGVKNAFGKRWEYFKDSHYKIENEIISILSEDNAEGDAICKIKEHLSSPVFNYGFSKDDNWFAHLYHHSQEIEKASKFSDKLPIPENLRNPIVQQGINEMRRLVNSLMEKYQNQYGDDFRFDAIKVEMGRDLRNSKSARQELTFRIRDNESKNEEARARLAEYGLQQSRSNINKYLMWKEIEEKAGAAKCPYTGKTISISDLLGTDNSVQIEHIIPYSVSLDDGFGNKTICESHFNNLKGELTPYQFYQKRSDKDLWGVNSWDAVVERAFQILPYNKAKRFTSKKDFEKSSFIERQLNDSRYIAKKSIELLSNICENVRVMPGQLTAELRHLWGINNVLQKPVVGINDHVLKLAKEETVKCYLVVDEENNVIDFVKKQNDRPNTKEGEILIPVSVNKNKLISNLFSFDIDVDDLQDGKYWIKVNLSDDFTVIPKHIDKANVDDDRIVFRGKIEKQVFKNDTSGNVNKTGKEDGVYWANFGIKDKKFVDLKTNKERPKTKSKKQIVLFGNVANDEFKCYIYNCQTNLPDGKYWLILDIDYNDVSFEKAINEKPELRNDQVCLSATVDQNSELILDVDKTYKKQVGLAPGKYYSVYQIVDYTKELCPIENQKPKVANEQKIIEGSIWVDKYTGEAKFDPKKNRDDHRHHAIDAIVIALTEQSYLQHLSTYNAKQKARQRGKIDSTEKFSLPWTGFINDVHKKADEILISYKKQNKVLTKNKKGFSVRGQLHKENVFGKRQAPNQEQGYHRRTKVTDLENNKHIAKVVDDSVRKIILDHLRYNCAVDISNPKGFKVPKDAFVKDGEWQLFLPNKRGDKVPIKKVRIKESIGNAAQLKSNINQFVNPRNNHHVVIYEDFDGNLQENVVQFWTVVERQMNGEEIYKLPHDGKNIITTLEINDMFILGLSDEEFEDNKSNYAFLSKYLYRVQKVSSMYYTFRYHLASTVTNNEQEFSIRSMKSFVEANPIKLKINEHGKLV
ncbi:MAG: hypothetical protein C0596_06850 [Marinilabiliales bacterium]|nr:MAG: hypothetical protein C0596_06850 [Marinilabiliales bacterium]